MDKDFLNKISEISYSKTGIQSVGGYLYFLCYEYFLVEHISECLYTYD